MFTWLYVKLREISQLSPVLCSGGWVVGAGEGEGEREGEGEEQPTEGFNSRAREVAKTRQGMETGASQARSHRGRGRGVKTAGHMAG